MKKVMLISLFCVIAQIFSVTIDGYAFLEGESDYSGIEVFFQKVAPDTLFNNTAYSDSTGYYTCVVEDGWYDVTYSKSEFISTDTTNVVLYSDQTLPDQTLSNGVVELFGSISGIIPTGEYHVTGTITVGQGDSLLIEPGVTFNFATGTALIVNGYLKAEGTVNDSIYFNTASDNWNGITLTTSSTNASLKFCSMIKTVTAIYISNLNTSISNTTVNTLGDGIIIDNSNCSINSSIITGDNNGNADFAFEMIVDQSCYLEINNCKISNFNGCLTTDYTAGNGELIIANSLISTEMGLSTMASSVSLFNVDLIVSPFWAIDNYWTFGNLYVYNSTIYCPDPYGMESGSGINHDGNVVIENSNVYGFDVGDYNCGPYIGVIVTTNANGDPCDAYGNISMDPKFVDVANGDFRLQSDSPCIDAGINTISGYTFPDFDLDGNTRILDGNNDSTLVVDMGAYEYFEVITAPNSPTNTIISVVSNTLTIDWDSMTGAYSYLIYHSDEPYGTFELIDSVGTSTWNITIDANTKKFYQIVASSDGLK